MKLLKHTHICCWRFFFIWTTIKCLSDAYDKLETEIIKKKKYSVLQALLVYFFSFGSKENAALQIHAVLLIIMHIVISGIQQIKPTHFFNKWYLYMYKAFIWMGQYKKNHPFACFAVLYHANKYLKCVN